MPAGKLLSSALEVELHLVGHAVFDFVSVED
jgi:hypothetical protein